MNVYDFEDCRANWSYNGLLKHGQILYGEHIKTFGLHATQPISKPLGVLYDEVNNHWIVADSGNNALRIFGINSVDGDLITATSLKNPSAMATWSPGSHIAVLDQSNIRIYDQQAGRFFTVADVTNCRGLGVTNGGELVTIQGGKFNSEIVFYSPKVPNKILYRTSYDVDNGGTPKPCFLDVSNSKLCITDLGVNGFTLYDMDLESLNLKLKKQIIEPGHGDGQFRFISGVKFDVNDELLIADASGFKLQFFDSEGQFHHRVRFSDGFLYASSFSLNSFHQLFACDRNKGTLKLYQLKGIDQDSLKDVFPSKKQFTNFKKDSYDKRHKGRDDTTKGKKPENYNAQNAW